ncbi:MAG: hypothetical protein V1781_07625 [Bacteroidota bacterium]
MNRYFRYNNISLALLLLFIFIGCKKDRDEVPNVYVDIYLYSTDPDFLQLNAIGGWIYISGGSKGIIVFRKSQTEFMAYDRHCTYKTSDANQVAIDASNLIATDAVCGSKFLITDGSANQGPATIPLKYYQVIFDGTVLHIFN